MRECGGCFACCVITDIAELGKPAGVPCQHLVDGKCGIYDTRPQVCRDFECGWKLDPRFREDERPSDVGVMVMGIPLGRARLNVAHELREGAFGTYHGNRLIKREAHGQLLGLAEHGKPATLTQLRICGPSRLVGAFGAHVRRAIAGASS